MKVVLKNVCEVTKCYGFKAGDICSIVDCPETEISTKFEFETWVEHPVNKDVFAVLYEDEYDLLEPKSDTEIKFTRKQELQIAKVNRGTCNLQTSLKLELLGFDAVCEKVWCFYSGVFEVLTTLEIKLYMEIGRYYKIICNAPQVGDIAKTIPPMFSSYNMPQNDIYEFGIIHEEIGYFQFSGTEIIDSCFTVQKTGNTEKDCFDFWVKLKQADLLEKEVQDAK
jgi:hypothetical protein